jgi:lysylphosphatidylglycerol synthetase-like protein (DUF2156 family)
MTVTATARPPSPAGTRPAAIAAVLLGDLIAPAGVYYAARALGAPVMLAVILGGLACLPRQAAGLARHGRVDGLGVAVLIVFAVSGVLSLLSGDARVLVVKDAVWPLAAAAVPRWCRRWPFCSCSAAAPCTASGPGWASAGRSRR